MDLEGLRSKLSKHDQSHLLQFWDTLSGKDQSKLYDDLQSIDYDEMGSIFKAATVKTASSSGAPAEMETVEESLCASIVNAAEAEVEAYRNVGMDAICKGEIGVLLLAGGQGTRLGVPYPKGMYNIGLPSKKTLYQIQIERILHLEELAREKEGKAAKNGGGRIVMYIMTSEMTKGPTVEFFEANGYFGLDKDRAVIFEQRMIPCFDMQGRIILESPSAVSRAPDGNGGLYWALRHENILQDFEARGVKYLHVYCVDNVLVKVADPVFMGYAIGTGAESANKVVEKAFAAEPVGVVCKVEGKIQVVEYSEISKETSELRNPSDGKLTFGAGNICNHFFTSEFLKRVCLSCDHLLPYHVAKKAIPYANPETGQTVAPKEPNGIKCEKFVFDVFQFSKSFVIWECLREDEFSPLKNADAPSKKDTPTTARLSLFDLHKRYIQQAGGVVVKDGSQSGEEEEEEPCEISPMLTYAGENLEGLVQGKTFKLPVILDKKSC